MASVLKVAGGAEIGMGHVSRSLALAGTLAGSPLGPVGFWAGRDRCVRNRIRDAGYALLDRNPEVALEELRHVRPGAVVFDQPETSGGEIRDARRSVPDASLVALDYFDMTNDELDLIVNLYNHADEPAPRDPRVGYLEGPRFAIIRNEFRSFRPDSPSPRVPARRVVVTFGGSDPAGNTSKVLGALRERVRPNLEITVITGPWLKGQDEIREQAGGIASSVSVVRDPPDIERRMATADLAVCGGGTTLLEFAYLAVPTVVLPQEHRERRFALSLEERGVSRVVRDMGRPAVREVLEEACVDGAWRSRTASSAHSLVDGKGRERIVEAIARTRTEQHASDRD